MLRVVRANTGKLRSQLIDAAVAEARGEYLLLLDASVQVLEGQWLDEMLQHAQRAEVAVVGAKLVNTSGRVVEAGRVLGVSSVAGPASRVRTCRPVVTCNACKWFRIGAPLGVTA